MKAKIDRKKLRQRITTLRKEAGISQEELSKIIGVDGSSIANYENGKRIPKYESILKYADHFGVSVDWLLGRTDASLLGEFELAVKGLSPRVQKILLEDKENATPYLELCADLLESGIPVRELRDLLKNIFTIRGKLQEIDISR